MANPEHLAILKQGSEKWNEWRKKHPRAKADLSHAYVADRNLEPGNLIDISGTVLSGVMLYRATLSQANLNGAVVNDANLRWADLSGATLSGAFLSESKLFGANLAGTELSESKLDGADFGRANLQGANLSWADLTWTNLGGADLSDADFTGARFGYTNLANVDLSATKGLEAVRHFYPSTVGIDTIYKSRGKIPEVFLRGCGVPDEVIELVRSVRRGPIQYHSCFISYSTKDQAFADRLYADLQAKGVRCWFAPHDIKGGRKIHEQIDEAIRVHDKLLLILSENSMTSDWVGTEIANAREREAREKKQMLFPITIAPFEEVKQWKKFDADLGRDSAREIREYYIPDFSGWARDHGAYQKALTKLIGDLKA
jgi:hypothetical protein